MTPQIEQIQPDVYFKLLSESAFSNVTIFKIREKRLDTEVSQALRGLKPRNGKSGATIEVLMPSLRVDRPNAPGPEAILEMRILTREQPAINLGANGTGLTSETLAVAIIQTLHQDADAGDGVSWYPDSRPYEPLPLEPDKPFISHQVKMLTTFPLNALPKMPTPSISDDGNGNVTITDSSGLLDSNGNPAAIYYTTDGSFPGPGALASAGFGGTAVLYDGPFQVASGTQIRWAAYLQPSLYTGSDRGNSIVTCNPPVLTAGPGSGGPLTAIAWTYGGPAPAYWEIYFGASANGPWQVVNVQIPPSSAWATNIPGKWWMVQGMGANDNPITPMSNSAFH